MLNIIFFLADKVFQVISLLEKNQLLLKFEKRSIIPNSKLRDLIAKGPKYREPCKVDWDKNLSLLCEAVDQYAL